MEAPRRQDVFSAALEVGSKGEPAVPLNNKWLTQADWLMNPCGTKSRPRENVGR